MADVRLVLLAAQESALKVASYTVNSEATTKPTGLRVYRHRLRGYDLARLPDVSVFYLGETHIQEEQAGYGNSQREIMTGALCRAAIASDDEMADDVLMPILAWAELALLGQDFTLGGAANNARFESIEPIEASEKAEGVAAALVRIKYTIHTKLWDPRQRP